MADSHDLCAPKSGGPRSEQALLARWDLDIRRAARKRAWLLGGQADVDDLVQEARMRLLKVARATMEKPDGYIRKVIANAVLAAAYRERRAPGSENVDEQEIPGDSGAVHLDRADDMNGWLDALPARLREVYRVLYAEEHTQREAASVLGLSQPRIAQLHQVLLAKGRTELQRPAA